MRRLACGVAVVLGLVACRDTAPTAGELSHEAYVWQRHWTPAVRGAVASPARPIEALRVLAGEISGERDGFWPAVDVSALASSGLPVTAVVRIGGSRPIVDFDSGELEQRIEGWRASGVNLVGLEIDHDCATAALADYAAWLDSHRPRGALRWSATALPTWASSPDLPAVAAAVDELVVQVHAVRAPEIFSGARARAWLESFAAALGGRSFRVSLPTYRVDVGGRERMADPGELARFVGALRERPVRGLAGVLWFRLPVQGDDNAWAAPTLAAVIAGRAPAAAVTARAVPRAPGRYDLVLENPGTADGPWPTVELAGDVDGAELVGGYVPLPHRQWRAPTRRIRPGEQHVIGWATGREVSIHAP